MTENQRKVCDACGQPKPLRHFFWIGEPTSVERAYCSAGCARRHFPEFSGK
jgi:hypothetical protein